MTTAHRPTWKAAVGKSNEGGWAAGGSVSTLISALDAPAHQTLKVRKGSQLVDDRQAVLRKSLLELEQAEKQKKDGPTHTAFKRRGVDPVIEQAGRVKLLKQTADVDTAKLKEKYDDSDIDDGGGMGAESDNESNLDTNNNNDFNSDGNSDLDASDTDDDKGSDDEDDDEAALQAELTKIRAEREAAKQQVEQEAAAEENAKNEQAALLGNPLLKGNTMGDDGNATMGKRRRWNDDVVFRNQAKGEPVPKKRFINDTVRNDFHKRFLHKFIH
jgi:protein CWC15